MTRLVSELLVLAHVSGIIVWLGCDLVVFTLSLSVLKRELPLGVRIERAELAEKIDWWVLIAFLVTLPLGVSIAWLRGYPLFETSWLSLKLALYGVIVVIAMFILTSAGATSALLKEIGTEGADVDALEKRVRRRVIGLAPPVVVIFACILASLFVALNPYRF